MKRWMVERTPCVFEDVKAEHMTVVESGALTFYNGTAHEPRNLFVLAPGQWVSVSEGDE